LDAGDDRRFFGIFPKYYSILVKKNDELCDNDIEGAKKENDMKKLVWHTEQRKVNDLIPFEGNPRKMTEKQVKDLKKSLERLNLIDIPAIDIDNTLVGGHQRMKIMQLLDRGEEIIDVRVPNRKLTDQEIIEANLRLNKNLGDWDFDMLANFDEEMLKDVGWQQFEINQIFQLNMDDPNKEWSNMPEFESEENMFKTLKIHFETEKDYESFKKIVDQKITNDTKYIWYPEKKRGNRNTVQQEL
jgi:hypothetical protein